MAQATARHILVDTETKCEELKKDIEGGQDFAEVAKEALILSVWPQRRRTWAPSAPARWFQNSTPWF